MKTCINFAWRKERVGNENENYRASAIARDTMPEPVVIDLDSDDDDSLTDTASKNESEIFPLLNCDIIIKLNK